MKNKNIYNFNVNPSRIGTQSEKYDALNRYYGTTDVDPFWVADMDLQSPKFLVEALEKRINHSIYGYTISDPSIFNAIQWWMENQHNVSVNLTSISLSPSVVTTMSMAIKAFTDIGDNIVILSPVYGPFFTTITSHNRNVIDLPLVIENNRFELPYEQIEKSLSKEKVKMFFLCNPHNPGGRVWKRDELEWLVKTCKKNNVLIFSDEIHSDIVYKPHTHHSILSIKDAQDIIIMAHSIGKTFNTSGLKSSFIIIPNNEVKKKLVRQQKLSHVDNINLFGKIAIKTLMSQEGVIYKNELLDYLRKNTEIVFHELSKVSLLNPMLPDATFLVWCDFRRCGAWQETSKKLINEAKVALSGGTFFGASGEGWFRVNCGHPRELLINATERICKIFSH